MPRPPPGSTWNTKSLPVPGYQRVLLKLSGEVFGGGRVGIDPDVVFVIAARSPMSERSGVSDRPSSRRRQLLPWRASSSSGAWTGSAPTTWACSASVMNCLALQDFLEKLGIETRVQTAITMGQVAEPYIPRRAILHMEKGRVVIFGAGMGLRSFSTDTVAVQRALETRCDVVLYAKSGRGRRLQRRPRKDPTASRFDELTYDDAIAGAWGSWTQTAFTLCSENKLPMIVFGIARRAASCATVQGERIGTLVRRPEPRRPRPARHADQQTRSTR